MSMLMPGATETHTMSIQSMHNTYATTPTRGELLIAQAEESFERSTPGLYVTEERVKTAELKAYGAQSPSFTPMPSDWDGTQGMSGGTTPEYIRQGDWNETHPWYRPGIDWREKLTVERARIYAEDVDERKKRQTLIAHGKERYGFFTGVLPGIVVGEAVGMLDPVNWLLPGRAATLGLRVSQPILRGALKGAVGNAMVDTAVFPNLNSRGADLGFAEAVEDITVGALTSGALSSLGIGAKSLWSKSEPTARPAPREAAGAGAKAQAAPDGSRPAQDSANIAEAPMTAKPSPPNENLPVHEATPSGEGAAVHDRSLPGDSAPATPNESPHAEDSPRPQSVAPTRYEQANSLRHRLSAEDQQVAGRAMQAASEQFASGQPVNVQPVLETSPTIGRVQVEGLVHTLETQQFTDVSFGALRPEYKEALGAIRTREGVPLLQGDELILPANVVTKLHQKRMLQDGMGAEKIAQLLLDVFHAKGNTVSTTRYPHIQALLSLRKDFVEMGFISMNPKTGDTVIQSVYTERKGRLDQRLARKQEPLRRDARIPSSRAGDEPITASGQSRQPGRLTDHRSGLAGEDVVTPGEAVNSPVADNPAKQVLRLKHSSKRFAAEAPESFLPATGSAQEQSTANTVQPESSGVDHNTQAGD